MKNIREIAGLDPKYSEINQEERNYAALFYHVLMKEDNAAIFLQKCGFGEKPKDDFGMYFEYSMIRDLWSIIVDESTKREIIRQKLEIENIDQIMKGSPLDINNHFGVKGNASKGQVQYPGNWVMKKYDETIEKNDDFHKVCKFKWAFNIKPDIVIHLGKNRAICIETKYKSGEGRYPSQKDDKSIFIRRGLPYVRQMELQKFMMEELLGIETQFVFLVFKKPRSNTQNVMTWKEAFCGMDLKNVPKFAKDMLENVNVNYQ